MALRRGWSPVNLLHIFRTPFSKNTTSAQLLFDIIIDYWVQKTSCSLSAQYTRKIEYTMVHIIIKKEMNDIYKGKFRLACNNSSFWRAFRWHRAVIMHITEFADCCYKTIWRKVREEKYEYTGAALQRCSLEKVFWKYAANLQENTHTEITLQHWCFPLNLRHIFGTPFSKNTSEGLLLKIKSNTSIV